MRIQSVTRNHRLQELVERLREVGLSEGTESLFGLSDDQRAIYADCEVMWKEFMEVEVRRASKQAENTELKRWILLRNDELRLQFQKAALAGMLYLRYIQERAIYCGSIPDPKDEFKYFHSSSDNEAREEYHCWGCGAEVRIKTQRISIRLKFSDGEIFDRGEVRTREVPYCPNCEKEPAASGVVYE